MENKIKHFPCHPALVAGSGVYSERCRIKCGMTKFLSLCFLLLLAACSGKGSSDGYSPYGGTEEPTQVKIGKPYEVQGETYVPKYEPTYSEEGVASWYGPQFHGRMTASGEKYDKHEMTAAHRTLPMPSIAKVTRLDTGKSVKVRINDRGPFAHSRVIDISQAAAEELDMIRSGTARVKVEYLSPDTEEYISSMGLTKPEGWGVTPQTFAAVPAGDIAASELPAPQPLMTGTLGVDMQSTAPATPSVSLNLVSPAYAGAGQESRYRIQTASFSSQENAERVAGILRGVAATMIKPVQANGQQFYRVSLGPLSRYEEAERVLAEVQAMGYRDARIMVDDI